MNKTAIAMLMLAAGIMAASCQKESEPEIKSFEPMTINAVSEGVGTATKTEMAYKYDILWSEDDQIYVTDGTSNDTFTLSSGAGTTKGTFTQDGEASFTSEVQAYYPATMVQDGGLVWPANQTNDQTVPMYSSKTVSSKVENFSFASLGSVLQIVFNTTQANVILKSIEIKDGEKTMSGAFTIDTDGKANITATDKAGITLDLGESGAALGKGANFFNIAMPAGDYQDLTLTFTATDEAKCVMTGGKINIEHNSVGKLVLAGNTFKPDLPAGALPGVFTVSDDDGTTKTQILFSQGNLYYDGSKFNFEANQYDTPGSGDWSTDHISHFYWSKNADSAIAEDYDWSGSDNDVFFTNDPDDVTKPNANFTVNVGGKEQSGWRTLSTNEWQYLLNTRTVNGGTGEGHSYSLNITYGEKLGLVLYPDNYTGSVLSEIVEVLPEGVVFLPTAGDRSGSNVGYVGGLGFYWSSSVYVENSAYCVLFNSHDVLPDDSEGRNYGFSVRLITESK